MNKILQKAYVLYTAICLFVVPLIFFPFLNHAFTQGKQLFFKMLLLIFIIIAVDIVFFARNNLITIKAFWNSRLAQLIVALGISFIFATIFSATPLPALFGTYSRGLGLFTMLFIGVWFFLSCSFSDEKTIIKALFAAFLAGIVLTLYAISQKIGYDPLLADFNANLFVGRSYSFLGNPSVV